MVHLAGVSSRTLSKVAYPNLPSAIRPIPHSDDLPVPVFQSFKNLRNEIPSGSSTEQDILMMMMLSLRAVKTQRSRDSSVRMN